MFTKTAFALLAGAASVLAVPLEARTSPPANYFTPSARYNYDVATGAIDCNPAGGKVYKAPNDSGNDVTTLVTFTYPPESAGLQCQFYFYLDNTATVQGSTLIDVYTSLAPAPGCTSGWGPGNQRNQNIGRLAVADGTYANWVATYGTYMTEPVPCKAPGTQEGFELVGVFDNDLVTWNGAVAGSRMAYF